MLFSEARTMLWAKPKEVMHEYGLPILSELPESNGCTAIILAIDHKEFLTLNLSSLKSSGTLIYDVKGILPANIIDSRL